MQHLIVAIGVEAEDPEDDLGIALADDEGTPGGVESQAIVPVPEVEAVEENVRPVPLPHPVERGA